MIFPEIPKHYQWMQTAPELLKNNSHTVETPLRGVEETTEPSKITVQEWWIQHGLATDPAASSSRNTEEPIDWWARDAWEFYALCVGMICWIVFWYGVHTGAWR